MRCMLQGSEIGLRYARKENRQKGGTMSGETFRKLVLERWQIVFLFIYYALLASSGSFASAAVFIPGPLSHFDLLSLAIVGSASMACSGSAIFYFRKLYKSILRGSLTVTSTTTDLNAIATFAYFVARPLFSVIFALLIVIGIKSGLALSGAAPANIGYGYVQMTMFFSFFAGFLSGRFIRKLETWGERMIDRLSNEVQHGG